MNTAAEAAIIGQAEIRRGVIKTIGIPNSVRDRHLYIVGKSGTGKSTLITNAVIANINSGEGVCVIDPHGDLVATGENPLLNYIPENRISDTVYFNAADKEYPLALNMLSATQDDELSLLADNLLITFRKLSDGWGPRMDDILRATLQTLMHVPGTTFLDIKRLLHNPDFRRSIVRQVSHPMLQEFWEEDFPRYPKDAPTPIIARVNKFLFLPQLYAMLSSAESKLDFHDIIENKKILLVNLASGSIGEDNAQLIGSMIVTQLQMAIMRRASVPPERRHPYYLYVDEFQNFTTAAFEKILSEARKYKLCLTLAHQFISQLPDTQRDAIFGNVGTMIMFTCGDKDAGALRYQLGRFEVQDLVNLRKYEALCRPESAQDTFLFKTIPPPPKPLGFAQAIIEYTRAHYGVHGKPLAEVPPKVAAMSALEPAQENAAETTTVPTPMSLRPVQTKQPAQQRMFATASREEKVLLFLETCGYLSTQQLKELCFAEYTTEGSKKKGASLLLNKLEGESQISSLLFAGEKLWYLGKKPNARQHDLLVRDVFVEIVKAEFKILEVKLFNSLIGSELQNPDLSVVFVSEDDTAIPTFWEFDNNTEGDVVLLAKISRYQKHFQTHKIVFVFADETRIKKLISKLPAPLPPIYYTTLERTEREGGFGGMREAVFNVFGSGDSVRLFGEM
jgi:hypothetical protein